MSVQQLRFRNFALFVPLSTATLERAITREHVTGAFNKAKGAVKEAVGKVTGSKKMQAEGKADKAKGTISKTPQAT